MKITIIPSAAYVGSELAAEYGCLPPTFLPVGHQRLYELQIASLQATDIQTSIYLTLPQSFEVPLADIEWFERHRVQVIAVPDRLTLSESILFALEMVELSYDALNILHGDTLIYDLPLEREDVAAIGVPPDGYSWGAFTHQTQASTGAIAPPKLALAGYFAFSNPSLFRGSLARSQGDFVEAIELYNSEKPIDELEVNNWMDFGHLQTFYRARCRIRTQRNFNELSINFHEIRKSSERGNKIYAESNWFDSIPAKLRTFTPAFLGRGSDPRPWYKLEYLPIPSLHELFVFGALEKASWEKILDACFIFMESCLVINFVKSSDSEKNALQELVLNKTGKRLNEFLSQNKINPELQWGYEGKRLPSLHEIVHITSKVIHFENQGLRGVMHGDLCFTNIFYDFRTQKVQVIDPRGTIDDLVPSIYGDIRYDMAKLGHSIFGGYDFILANRYNCEGFDQRDLSIQFYDDGKMKALGEIAKISSFNGLSLNDLEIKALIIHLFLAMLPLHSDRPDRQKAFLANALRLYSENFS